jgi:hypothetical protein
MNARRLFAIGALAAALAVLASGCSHDMATSAEINERGGQIYVNVSPGTTPEYSWDDGYGMAFLSVSRLDGAGGIVWEVWGTAPSPCKPGVRPGLVVSPPVQHGVAPEGTLERVRKETRLTPGVRYVVLVVQDGQANSARGWVEFTPQ